MHPKAGWYPDPTGRFRSRYWDGDRWREFVDRFRAEDPLRPTDPETFDIVTVSAQMKREDSKRRIRVGCALVVLWIVGGTVTWIGWLLYGFRYCGDAIDRHGLRECERASEASRGGAWGVLFFGFGIIVLITVAVVVAYGRARRIAAVESPDGPGT